jgi:hypothetical protein
MPDAPEPDARRPELNPSLRQRREILHDTRRSSPPPVDTTSVQRDEGRVWPLIWLIVFLVCVAIAIYLLV